MRLAGAFFANRADVVDDMLNIDRLVDEVPAPLRDEVHGADPDSPLIEPNGGRHVYSFRLEGSHERFIQ